MEKASEAILGLKPVTFRYKPEIDPEGDRRHGANRFILLAKIFLAFRAIR
jgi:hypothetical protein